MPNKDARNIFCRAFGYIITKTLYEPGDIAVNRDCKFFNIDEYEIKSPLVIDKLHYNGNDNCIIWLNTKGHMQIVNKETNEIEDRFPGASNLLKQEKIGKYVGYCIEPATVFSIWFEMNLEQSPIIPNVKYFKLNKGEIYNAPLGTKLFLAEGILDIDGQSFVGNRQIRVSTEPKTFLGLTDCYGLFFP
jgi:hypothetical protein